MSNEKTTLLVIVMAIGALFGAIFGGLTAYFLSPETGYVESVTEQLGLDYDEPEVDRAIVKLIEEETATIRVVEQVTPAVVSVVAKREYSGELVEVGGGTGFFVTSDGLVLTNRHVVSSENGVVYSVLTNDGDEYAVELIAKDTINDLAVLQVLAEDGEELPSFPIVKLGDSDLVQNGQTVIAIGNALSEYQNSITKGVVSGTGRRVVAGNWYSSEVIEEAIQTDAAINPGNSGGPLINLLGEVIGVNTATSSSGEGLGFAIPVNPAKKVIDDVIEYGRIIRPWLGVRYVMISEALAEENDLGSDYGALVLSGQSPADTAVVAGSPADLAGLQNGDIILMIDGVEINTENTLSDQVNVYEPGDLIEISIIRDGQEIVLEATLDELDPSLFE